MTVQAITEKVSWWMQLLTPENTADLITAIVVILIPSWIASHRYKKQKENERRDERAQIYAEAIAAVEDYLEVPYLVIRRNEESPQAMTELTTRISEIQKRLNFSKSWIRVHATEEIAQHFEQLVRTIKHEAGPQISEAWNSEPHVQGKSMPLGEGFTREQSDAKIRALVDSVRMNLGIEKSKRWPWAWLGF